MACLFTGPVYTSAAYSELATAATACRPMAYQEGERAKKMENPSLSAPMENTAQRFVALAAKFEAARKAEASAR